MNIRRTILTLVITGIVGLAMLVPVAVLLGLAWLVPVRVETVASPVIVHVETVAPVQSIPTVTR